MSYDIRARSPSDLVARPASPAEQGSHCDPCRRQGTNTVGSRWCTECAERFCDDCARCHATMTVSKSHMLTNLSSGIGIGTGQADAVVVFERGFSPKCSKHFSEGLTLYCKRCRLSYCALCSLINHCGCGGTSVLLNSFNAIQNMKRKYSSVTKNFSQSVHLFRQDRNRPNHLRFNSWILPSPRPGDDESLFALSRLKHKPDKLPVAKCKLHPVATLEVCQHTERDWVNSIALMRNGLLLIVQLYAATLKCITPHGSVVASCGFYSNPWAVTLVKDNLAAVTLPERKHIQLVKVKGDSLEPSRRIATKHKCLGVCAVNGRLVTTCLLGCVHVISLTGDEFMSLNKNHHGERLFKNPEYIVSNPAETTVYITDFKRNTLTALSVDGNRINPTPVFSFSDPDLRGPRGVSVDAQGFIYTCGMPSRNIFKLGPDGKKIQAFRRKQVTDLYEDICVSGAGDLAFVSTYESDIQVYALTSKDLCQACEIFRRLN